VPSWSSCAGSAGLRPDKDLLRTKDIAPGRTAPQGFEVVDQEVARKIQPSLQDDMETLRVKLSEAMNAGPGSQQPLK
jgi:hypothetical protein